MIKTEFRKNGGFELVLSEADKIESLILEEMADASERGQRVTVEKRDKEFTITVGKGQ